MLIQKSTWRRFETLLDWKPNPHQRNFSFSISFSSLNFNIISWSSQLNSLTLHHHHTSRSKLDKELKQFVLFEALFQRYITKLSWSGSCYTMWIALVFVVFWSPQAWGRPVVVSILQIVPFQIKHHDLQAHVSL
jgi:hypothetical protein